MIRKFFFLVFCMSIFVSSCKAQPEEQSLLQDALSKGTIDGQAISGNPELQEMATDLTLQMGSAAEAENTAELSRIPKACDPISHNQSDGEIDGFWQITGSGYEAVYDPNGGIGKTNFRFTATPSIYRVQSHPEYGITTADEHGIIWVRILNQDGLAGWVPASNGSWCSPLD